MLQRPEGSAAPLTVDQLGGTRESDRVVSYRKFVIGGSPAVTTPRFMGSGRILQLQRRAGGSIGL